MKKLFLFSLFIIGATLTTQAQEIADNAIGLRFGGGNDVGTEISYQRALGDNNRLEVGLGWREDRNSYNAYKLTGIYQWVWNIEGGFNWYAGAGGGLGNVDIDNNEEGGVFLFAVGDIGIEYNFNIPLLISLDFRPEISFGGYDVYDDFTPDVALALRYQF